MQRVRITRTRSERVESKTVRAWCNVNSDVVEQYVCDIDGHWVYLKDGYRHEETETGTINEYYVKDLLPKLKRTAIHPTK